MDGNKDGKYKVFRKLNMFPQGVKISPHPPCKSGIWADKTDKIENSPTTKIGEVRFF